MRRISQPEPHAATARAPLHPLFSYVAALASVVLLAACAGGDNAHSAAADSATAAADAAPPLPDSVSALTDSVMRIADASRITGNPDAKVWMIMMSDFQCPYCRQFHETVYPRIKKEYIDKGLIRAAYVNFLPSGHIHGRVTAERALCAGLQGKFWQYHDALFKSLDEWTSLPAGTAYFDSLSAKLGLDMNDMELCVSSGMMKVLVSADEMRSAQAGARATPTFLIGGTRVEGAQAYDVFKRFLDAAITASRTSGGNQ